MKIILILFVLLFSSSVFSDDISNFEIEGMNIGDNLLDYMSEEEIKSEINRTRYMYKRLTKEFGEVYIYEGLQTYDMISLFVRSKNGKYIIHAIFGTIPYIENINGCLKKRNEIVAELSKIFVNAKKEEVSYKHGIDPTGRSINQGVYFSFKSGEIKVECDNFEENLRIKNDWDEGLSVAIGTNAFIKWMSNIIN